MEPPIKPHSVPVLSQPRFYLGLLLAVYLILGLRVVTHYGASWDEAPRYNYAQRSLAAYSGQAGDLTDDKGPFYGMLALLGGRGFQALIPGWMEIDGWHFMTFLSYLLGVYFFYRLAQRWIEPTPALAATLLFSTQPVLWGHGFINPKDTPFMAFFIASICLGLEMVDHFHPLVLPQKITPVRLLIEIRRQLSGDWSAASARSKRLLMGLGIALALLALGAFPLRLGSAWLVEQAYHASPSSALGAWFGRLAGQAQQIPVQAYAAKAQMLTSWGVLALVVSVVLVGFGTARMIFRTLAARIECLVPPRVLLAAAFLGFCSDIRSLGIASGALIAVYFWIKIGRKSLPFLLEYLGAGALTLYFFWPYLWNQPGKSFLETLTKSADFSSWNGTLLFGGQVYANKGQPDSYLPTLFSIQLTEPALVLILAGLVIAGVYFIRHSHQRLDFLLLGAWFAAPVGAAILLHSTIYNNFRQFLFVIPPLFILAGLALQVVWDLLKRRMVFFAPITLLLLLPALYWNFQLHPYQYVYYNNLAGGVGGASRVYEGDYWLTANKEGVEYLNRVASEGASAVVFGKISFTYSYARPDLTILQYVQPTAADSPRSAFPGYAVLTSQYDMDRVAYPDSPILYQVERDGAVLLVVKQFRQGDLIQRP